MSGPRVRRGLAAALAALAVALLPGCAGVDPAHYASQRPALERGRVWHRRRRLDDEAMAEAASRLPRTPHDWAPFAGPVPSGYPTVRSLRRCEVMRCGARQLRVVMEADGFLPHQVRRTVGALERVGAGRLEPETFAALVDGLPGSVGPTAPARGLTLRSVEYPPGTLTWDDET